MADVFRFSSTDTLIAARLSITEIAAVTVWQSSYDYDFEFHNGHPTGYPIYVRPSGNTDTSNIPKFDTLNKSATNYNAISKFANHTKLTSALRNTAQQDILNVISNNWATLSLLATRWWTNQMAPVIVVPVVVPVATVKTCDVPNCGGQVTIVSSGKSPCDTCWKYQ